MKTKRTLSTWVIIFLTTLSIPVWGQFSGSGSGISTDPYIITSGDELTQVRNFLNKPTVCFKLLNDVDLTQWIVDNNPTQGWLPIGNSSTNAFSGNFNGNSCKIIGLKINRPTTDYVGLFGYLNSGANIHDLTLSLCDVSGQNYVGILAGIIELSNLNLGNSNFNFSSSINNIKLQGSLVGKLNVGGLIGCLKSNITVTAATSTTANLIYNSSSTLSLYKINMEGSVTGQGQTGGLVGTINSSSYSALLSNYYYYGTAYYLYKFANSFINISNATLKGTVKGQAQTGGLFGNISSTSSSNSTSGYSTVTIDQSGFIGNVTGATQTGGIVGFTTTVSNTTKCGLGIDRCFTSGNVTGLAGSGGIVGELNYNGRNSVRYISNSYSQSVVIGTTSVGGIVGKGYNPYVLKNYSAGSVRGVTSVGGILGESVSGGLNTVQSNVSINNEISGGSSVGRITGLMNVSETLTSAQSNYGWTLTKVIVNNINTAVDDSYQHGISYGLSQFKRKATYQGIGWDFTTKSFWGTVENQSYPYFTWQTTPAVITTSPIKAGNTTISGTSVGNAIINVTVGNKQYTTTAGSLNWSVVVDPMLGGDSITVIAMQDTLRWSYPVRGTVEFEGSGTLADPFKIYTARDLKAIESNMTANYKLMNDIDLTSWIQSNASATGWSSIGSKETSLMGSIDGDNKKITGFWQSSSQTSCGLVASVSTDGAIRNLTIQSATSKNTSGLDYTAVVTGYNYGTIENCNARGILQGYTVGSIAGYNAGTINKCIASGSITSIVSSGKAGGIAGDNTGLISECDYTGDIICNTGSGYLGGIAGSSSDSIVKCYYSGSLSSSIATAQAGGIAGLNSGLISISFSNGSISATGTTAYAGGIAGNNYSTNSVIDNSESTMNINTTGASSVSGGVVAMTNGKVINCYATGTISSGYRGSGVVGYMDGASAVVLGCVGLNTNISGKSSAFRVIGGSTSSVISPSNTDNYGCKDMLITINGVLQSTPAENYMQGTAKDRVDLKKQLFYEGIGWNFVSPWYIVEGFDYPYLRFRLQTVTGVSLNKSTTSLNVGANETLTVTAAPTNATYQNVTWTSSNVSVATVDVAGKVTAVAAGTATITATTVDQNKTAECIVDVILATGYDKIVNESIKIYPNPAENYLIVNSEMQYCYSIYSSTGIMIKSNLTVGANIIDISKLQQGYYFIKIDKEVFPFIKK